jgi:hypothetical protein
MNDMTFYPVEWIDVVPYDGNVFNLKTEAEEFVVAGVVVHNCPHSWKINADKVAREDCPLLWMGE